MATRNLVRSAALEKIDGETFYQPPLSVINLRLSAYGEAAIWVGDVRISN